jgi:signal transduction histidine kinase
VKDNTCILEKPINLSSKIALEYRQNSFSIELAGVNYTNPEGLKYTWKLEGFDKVWTEPSFNSIINYTNIPAGTYTLRMKTISSEGSVNERAILLAISAPWWFSTVAFIIYLIILAALIAGFILVFRIWMNERQAKEKIEFFTNVAHDLKTPLMLIQTPLEHIEKNKNLTVNERNFLKMSLTNVAKLNNYIGKLLDFQKIDTGRFDVNPTYGDVVGHVFELTRNYIPLLKEMGIKLRFESTADSFFMFYDREIFERIINNLLSNAIKYTQRDGSISVSFSYKGKSCFIRIRDTGIGIQSETSETFSENISGLKTQLI